MPPIHYQLREDTVFGQNGERLSVYGIDVYAQNQILSSYPELFFTREQGEGFVELCNASDLSPVHLPDVMEDFLAK